MEVMSYETIDIKKLNEFYVEEQGNICNGNNGKKYKSSCVLVLLIHYLKQHLPPDMIFELIQKNCEESPETIRTVFKELIYDLQIKND